MPPTRRGRARKVGLKRIDAALDALRSMGFPESLVRKTVRNLLEVYGGDEGWTFIEEGSYRLLIDSILEKLEKPEMENNEPNLLENSYPPLLIENGVSKDDIVQDTTEAQVHHFNGESEQVLSPKKLQQDQSSQSHCTSKSLEAVPSSKDETCHAKLGREIPSSQISAGVSSTQLFSLPPCESHPAQMRKPCNGWLSDDDE